MMFSKVPNEFVIKFYEWAGRDFRREIEVGFPLIRGVDCRTSYSLIDLMESLSKADRWVLASAILKHSFTHTRAVQLLNERLSSEEQAFLGRWERAFSFLGPLEQQRLAAVRSLGPSLEGKERRRILTHIKSQLNDPSYVWAESGPWKGMSFNVEVGAFRIETRLYTGMRSGFCYEHAIKNKEMGHYYWSGLPSGPGTSNENVTFYCDRIHLYSWLGISQQINWSEVRLGEVEQVARHVVRLCKHFVDGVSDLLDESYLSASQ